MNEIRNRCREAIRKETRKIMGKKGFSEEEKVVREIKKKIKREDLVMGKADKGILTRKDYEKKMEDFIKDQGYEKLQKNPLNAFYKKVKDTLKETEETIRYLGGTISIPMNPRIPRLYGMIKIHKGGNL